MVAIIFQERAIVKQGNEIYQYNGFQINISEHFQCHVRKLFSDVK